MTTVLAVDGGQSAIRLRHSSDQRVIEVEGVSRLEGDMIAAAADAVAEGWRRGGFEPVDRVVLGLTTAPVDGRASDRLCGLVGRATGAAEVWLMDDAVSAHAGALSGGWGVSLVAGTGVACLAVRVSGEPRIIGGHGSLLGDEGGAFWIGRHGLGAVLQAADGLGASTMLTELAERRFGELSDIDVRLHDAERPVNTIAQFAPEVMEAADANDTVAIGIVDEAVRQLRAVARAGAEWVGGGVVPLALGGRLLEPGGALRRRLDDLLASEDLPIVPRSADASALDGAMRLGLSGSPDGYRGLIHIWHAEVAGKSEPVDSHRMSEPLDSPGLGYLGLAQRLIGRLSSEEWPSIQAAARLVAGAIASGHQVHVFGTGHSHMLAEELFYRAGGLVRVSPILFEGLMLHASAPLSTLLERLPGLADALLVDHPIVEGDVLIVASNSGSNAVTSQLVQRVQGSGVRVIAVTSVQHATSTAARSTELPRLHELADVVIDNGGCVGDAAVTIEGFDTKVAPTSTVVGAAILNAVVAEAVQRLVEGGIAPEVYTSSNAEGGDAANSRFIRTAIVR